MGRLRALQFHRCGGRLRAARRGRTRDDCGGAAARSCARRPWPHWRLCDAAHRSLERAELLGVVSLPRRRHRRGVCAGAGTALALARHHGDRLRRFVDRTGHRRHASRLAHAAQFSRGRGLRSGRIADRFRFPARAASPAGPDRRRILCRLGGLSPRIDPHRAREQA